MKSIVLILLLGYLAFSQPSEEKAKSYPSAQTALPPTAQKGQASVHGGSNDYWKNAVRQKTKGNNNLTE